MILLIDNFDSFTYNLVDYFSQLDISAEVVRNSTPPQQLDFKRFSGVVISPGPEVPAKAGFMMEYFDYIPDTMPVLGICLGHQAIGEQYGARTVKAGRPMHGKLSRIIHEDETIFNGIESGFEAVRYNSLVVEDVTSPLLVIARSDHGEVMAIRHSDLPIWGLQFHPEAALTKFGLKMLSNWIEYNKIV